MTLIVLEVHVPQTGDVHSERDLIRALGDVAPHFLVYALSFLTLGIFWVAQGTQLRQLAQADRHLLWLHVAFLACVATMPFSTSLLANFTSYRTALIVYWLNILLLGVTLLAAWSYADRAGLVSPNAGPEVSNAIRRRIVVAQSLYAVGAALCIVSTALAIAFIVAVQLNYAIAPRLPVLSRL
jgi:TMEM175 potassium channel family protein